MNKKGMIGLLFIVSGLTKIFLLKTIITGNVVGVNYNSVLNLLGGLLFVAGIVLILISGKDSWHL